MLNHDKPRLATTKGATVPALAFYWKEGLDSELNMKRIKDGFSFLYGWFERHETLVALLGGISLVLFVATLAAIPLLVIALREDYFIRENRVSLGSGGMLYLVVRLVLLTVKNVLGLVVLLLGFIMLFVPGQGLLTLLVGLLLLNFPGKRRLELKLVRSPRVYASIRWIRAKAGVKPLKLPE